MLFFKKSLRAYIEKYASLDTIYNDALSLDEFNIKKNYYDKDGKKVFHLKYSPYLEGAVNLVLPRKTYLALAGSREFEVKKMTST